jgi:hypothetical protein
LYAHLVEPSTDVSFQSTGGEETGGLGFTGEVAVVTLCYPPDATGDQLWTKICSTARANFQKYVASHGYRLFFHDQPPAHTEGRPPVWHKIPALQEALSTDGVKYAFWMDADSIFVNLAQGLDIVLPPEGKEMTIVGDFNCFLNAGHFVMHRGTWSTQFLNDTWALDAPPKPDLWFEQSAMIYLLTGRNSSCEYQVWPGSCCDSSAMALAEVHVVEHSVMNSYTEEYKDGDLLIHFAGRSTEDKVDLMEEYAKRAGSPSLLSFHAALMELVWASAPGGIEVCFK